MTIVTMVRTRVGIVRSIADLHAWMGCDRIGRIDLCAGSRVPGEPVGVGRKRQRGTAGACGANSTAVPVPHHKYDDMSESVSMRVLSDVFLEVPRMGHEAPRTGHEVALQAELL